MRYQLTSEEIETIEKTINEYLTAEQNNRLMGARMSVLRAIGVDVPQRVDTRPRPKPTTEARKKAGQHLRALWAANPQFREAQREGIRAYWLRKKAGVK